MSENTAKLMQGRKPDRAQDDGLKPQERQALWKMRDEAEQAGSQLTSGGKGGLPPSLVLGVMRRDKYRCKVCGELGNMEENGGIGVHHKGGVENPTSKWLAKKDHANDPNNLVTICKNCHDHIHEDDRDGAAQEEHQEQVEHNEEQ